MEFFVARAMQIACMTDTQISAIHGRELERGYCIPNWNIQELFHLSTIKDIHCIEDEPGVLAAHSQRVKHDLLSQKIAIDQAVEMPDGGQTIIFKPWDAITTGNVKTVHDFDWRVYNAISEGKINFSYSGPPAKKKAKGSRLRDRLAEAVE